MSLSATWSLNTTGFLELQWRIAATELATLGRQGYYLVQTYWESEQAFWDWTKSE